MSRSSLPPTAKRGRTRLSARAPTIADVAREAGVSPMTVSRVINRQAIVVDSTRARVEQAIALLGYVPNQAARVLAGARQCRIALVHDNPSAGWMSAVLTACLDTATRIDAQLLLDRFEEKRGPGDLVHELALQQIDGVILLPPLCDNASIVRELREAGMEVVLVACGSPPAQCDAVHVDDLRAAREMTARLLALGHVRIGFIEGNSNQTASALRLGGFRQALADAGIEPDPELIVKGDFTFESGLAAAGGLLALAAPPTAIFASNDDMAAAVIAAAHRHGIRVPGDLSVCGFDDTSIATKVWPPLATVGQPIGEMAHWATGRIAEAVRCARLGEPMTAEQCLMPYAIVERGSLAPAHGA